MALSTKHADIGYLAGRLAACAYPDGIGSIPATTWEQLHTHPVAGIGLLRPALAASERQDDVEEIMASIPADAADEPGGRKIETQSGVGIGYYHQRAAMRRARAMSPDLLRRIGEALWGDRWQADMRDALHLTDSTRIRDWLSGRRAIPAGVVTDLLALARARAGAATAAAAEIEVLIAS